MPGGGYRRRMMMKAKKLEDIYPPVGVELNSRIDTALNRGAYFLEIDSNGRIKKTGNLQRRTTIIFNVKAEQAYNYSAGAGWQAGFFVFNENYTNPLQLGSLSGTQTLTIPDGYDYMQVSFGANNINNDDPSVLGSLIRIS